MVQRMLPAPMVVRSQRQHSGDESNYSIGGSGCIKRSMTAVMKDDEDADEKRCRQHGQRQRNPIRYGDAAIDCVPERDIRTQGIEQLPRRFPSRRPLKSRNDVLPERSIRGGICPIDRIHACWATTPSRYPANTRESAPATPSVPRQPMSSERRELVCTVEHGPPWDNHGAPEPRHPFNIPCPYFRMARRCAWDRSRGAIP
jgi:hypothetical protein